MAKEAWTRRSWLSQPRTVRTCGCMRPGQRVDVFMGYLKRITRPSSMRWIAFAIRTQCHLNPRVGSLATVTLAEVMAVNSMEDPDHSLTTMVPRSTTANRATSRTAMLDKEEVKDKVVNTSSVPLTHLISSQEDHHHRSRTDLTMIAASITIIRAKTLTPTDEVVAVKVEAKTGIKAGNSSNSGMDSSRMSMDPVIPAWTIRTTLGHGPTHHKTCSKQFRLRHPTLHLQ